MHWASEGSSTSEPVCCVISRTKNITIHVLEEYLVPETVEETETIMAQALLILDVGFHTSLKGLHISWEGPRERDLFV